MNYLGTFVSITITPGSWSLEVKNVFIMRIDAAIAPIKIIKSNSGHVFNKISLGYCTWISLFLSPWSFEAPAMYISLTNLVFLSLFKISFELLDRPIAIPFKLETIFINYEIISCRLIQNIFFEI